MMEHIVDSERHRVYDAQDGSLVTENGTVEQHGTFAKAYGRKFRLFDGEIQGLDPKDGKWYQSAHNDSTLDTIRGGAYSTEEEIGLRNLIISKALWDAKVEFEKVVDEVADITGGAFAFNYSLEAGSEKYKPGKPNGQSKA